MVSWINGYCYIFNWDVDLFCFLIEKDFNYKVLGSCKFWGLVGLVNYCFFFCFVLGVVKKGSIEYRERWARVYVFVS